MPYILPEANIKPCYVRSLTRNAWEAPREVNSRNAGFRLA